jgi:hypothetical protein
LDASGDGVPDVVLGATNSIRLVSGSDGSVLYALAGEESHSGWTNAGTPAEFCIRRGSLAMLPDLDGDGAAEFAVMHGEEICIHSGRSGAFWHRIPMSGESTDGRNMISATDIDGDGQSDLLLGDPGDMSGGVSVYSVSRTKRVAWHPDPARGGWHYAEAMVDMQDLDGDGAGDYAVAHVWNGCPTPGRVFLISGSTGKPLDEFGERVLRLRSWLP